MANPNLNPSRWPAVAVVLLLHLGLLAVFSLQSQAWWHKPAPVVDAPDAAAANALTWLNLLPPTAEPGTRPAPVPQERRNAARQPRLLAEPTTTPPQAPIQLVPARAATTATAATPAALAPAQAEPAATPPPAPASAPPAPPLRLTLPRSALPQPVNPALADQRDRSAQRTLESRMQAALGTTGGPISEQRLADGSIVMRRGSQCVIARPARAGTLDPFNQSVSPLPRQIDRC